MANFQLGHALPDDDEDDEGNIFFALFRNRKFMLDEMT